MIENSIQQFRAQRNAKSRVNTVSASKERAGLGQRQIAKSQNELNRNLAKMEESAEPKYDPSEKVNAWAQEIADLRAERAAASQRADQEQSTTSAMDVNPMSRPRPTTRWDGPVGMSGGAGREGAEAYLGRPMDDKEWEMLARTTYAEATSDPEEQAAVMSVILNRVKADGYPDSITEVVNQPNQFQAVTGTSANGNRPSSMFLSFNDDVMSTFEAEVTPRLANYRDQNWLNFTAGNPAAYGEGTNIGFLDQVNNAEGSASIGGTIFGTVRN